MNIKEVRIGNYIQYTKDGSHFLIIEIGQNGFSVSNEDELTWIEYQHFEGINLTNDWIIRFGFEHNKTIDKYYTIGSNIAISIADNKFRFIQGNLICQLVLREIQYVHELQNLYYILTEKELIIK